MSLTAPADPATAYELRLLSFFLLLLGALLLSILGVWHYRGSLLSRVVTSPSDFLSALEREGALISHVTVGVDARVASAQAAADAEKDGEAGPDLEEDDGSHAADGRANHGEGDLNWEGGDEGEDEGEDGEEWGQGDGRVAGGDDDDDAGMRMAEGEDIFDDDDGSEAEAEAEEDRTLRGHGGSPAVKDERDGADERAGRTVRGGGGGKGRDDSGTNKGSNGRMRSAQGEEPPLAARSRRVGPHRRRNGGGGEGVDEEGANGGAVGRGEGGRAGFFAERLLREGSPPASSSSSSSSSALSGLTSATGADEDGPSTPPPTPSAGGGAAAPVVVSLSPHHNHGTGARIRRTAQTKAE